MIREIFEFFKNFGEHLGATGSIILALGFACIMFFLQAGARKGQQLQAKTQYESEQVEKTIEEYVRKYHEPPLDFYTELYPVQVYLVLRRLKRKDLISSRLKWRFFWIVVKTITFVICYFIIFGLIIYGVMKGLRKF